jgi:hypothetical protein
MSFTFLPRNNRPGTLVLLCLAALLAPGCGKNRPNATVKGKVSVGDHPVVSGQVMFIFEDEQAGASIKPDGTYEVKNALVGTAKVTVVSRRPGSAYLGAVLPEKMPEKERKHVEEMQKRERDLLDKWVQIPGKFSKPASSPLTFEVKDGDNTFDIKIPAKE